MPEINRYESIFYDNNKIVLKYSNQGNSFKVSSLSEFSRPVKGAGFAIKFVTTGSERYTVNKQQYHIAANSYLLLNGEHDVIVDIESKKNVRGICINISTNYIEQAVASFIRPDTAFPDTGLASFFYTDQFLENHYQAARTLLGSKMETISKKIQDKTFSATDINTDLFLELAENLVSDQAGVFKQLQTIPAIKTATKKELYRRLLKAKEFIDTNYTFRLTTEQIAKEAMISEYHFFRLFKKVFGKSPHQYILQKRLHAACTPLRDKEKIAEVALNCGFTDVYTFSKAFKKHFGIPPSSFAG
ncbi:MAG: AraC family transcriptional regulator [Ferruginibacter sp.]